MTREIMRRASTSSSRYSPNPNPNPNPNANANPNPNANQVRPELGNIQPTRPANFDPEKDLWLNDWTM